MDAAVKIAEIFGFLYQQNALYVTKNAGWRRQKWSDSDFVIDLGRMRTVMQVTVVSILLPIFNCGITLCQQLTFTSRAYLQSPVVLSSTESSGEFGFESVVLRNDGRDTISAVHFKLTLRAGTDDEVADERRVAVSIEPSASKRLMTELGHVEGLRQLVKSRKHAAALVILTVESVEFEGGREWHPKTAPQEGVPLDVPLRQYVPLRK